MKKLFLICFAMTASTITHAHDSLVPHAHPHDVSVLPDLYAMLGAAIAVACGLLVLRKIMR
jgi:uncharacterized GH25 family protein